MHVTTSHHINNMNPYLSWICPLNQHLIVLGRVERNWTKIRNSNFLVLAAAICIFFICFHSFSLINCASWFPSFNSICVLLLVLLQKKCRVSQNKMWVSQQNPKTRDHKRCIWNRIIPGWNRAYISCYISRKPSELGLVCQWEQSLWLSWWSMSTLGTGSKAESILPLSVFRSGSHSPCYAIPVCAQHPYGAQFLCLHSDWGRDLSAWRPTRTCSWLQRSSLLWRAWMLNSLWDGAKHGKLSIPVP